MTDDKGFSPDPQLIQNGSAVWPVLGVRMRAGNIDTSAKLSRRAYNENGYETDHLEKKLGKTCNLQVRTMFAHYIIEYFQLEYNAIFVF